MSEMGADGARQFAQVEAASEESFLSRWSRRKLGRDPAPEMPGTPPRAEVAAAEVAANVPAEPIDPRTGKPMSALTDADMPAIETLDENSDLAVFMAGKVSRALRMKAMTKVFHTPKFNQVCLCAEYADDYTNFTPLGDIVPHDLRQAIVREAGKLVERLTGQGVEITPEEARARVAAQFRGETAAGPAALADAADNGRARADAPAGTTEKTPDPPQRRSGPPVPPPQPETT